MNYADKGRPIGSTFTYKGKDYIVVSPTAAVTVIYLIQIASLFATIAVLASAQVEPTERT